MRGFLKSVRKHARGKNTGREWRACNIDMMRWSMPYTLGQRTQLMIIVLLSACTFAYGFISAFPAGDSRQVGGQTDQVSGMSSDLTLDVDTATTKPMASGDVVSDDLATNDSKSAIFSCVLQFPFELVLQAWEGGPPDPNFIREEVSVEKIGSEERKKKTIYTKNPLPYIVRKTVRAI